MKHIAPFIVMIVVLITITVVINSVLNYRLRRRLLESGKLDENGIKFLQTFSGWETETLKWGIIFFFGGIGLIVLEFMPFDPSKSSLPYGLELVFIALGFLVYYFIRRRQQ